jgi:hypothetical protein
VGFPLLTSAHQHSSFCCVLKKMGHAGARHRDPSRQALGWPLARRYTLAAYQSISIPTELGVANGSPEDGEMREIHPHIGGAAKAPQRVRA